MGATGRQTDVLGSATATASPASSRYHLRRDPHQLTMRVAEVGAQAPDGDRRMIVSGSLRIVIALLVVAALGWGFSWVASAMTGGTVSSPCSSTAPADCGNPFTNFDNYSSSHTGCSTASTAPVCRAESTATPGGLPAQEIRSGATPLKPGQITADLTPPALPPAGFDLR